MKARICDFCNSVIGDDPRTEDAIIKIKFYKGYPEWDIFDDAHKHYKKLDMCDKCKKRFIEWLKDSFKEDNEESI